LLVVLDTNVLVSGLLNPSGPPARILDLVLLGSVQVAFDDRLIAEYQEVLGRSGFDFSPLSIGSLLDHIQLLGVQVTAPPLPNIDPPDPDDVCFAEVALSTNAILVTGNVDHFLVFERIGLRVLAPAEFLDLLTSA